MLIVSRHDNQAIIVEAGGQRMVIRVKNERPKGRFRVRLEITAPPEMVVLREELADMTSGRASGAEPGESPGE